MRKLGFNEDASVDLQLRFQPNAYKLVSCTGQTHASTMLIIIGVITMQFTS